MSLTGVLERREGDRRRVRLVLMADGKPVLQGPWRDNVDAARGAVYCMLDDVMRSRPSRVFPL